MTDSNFYLGREYDPLKQTVTEKEITYEPADLTKQFSLNRIPAKENAKNRNDDQQHRRQRKYRVIGQRGAKFHSIIIEELVEAVFKQRPEEFDAFHSRLMHLCVN